MRLILVGAGVRGHQWIDFIQSCNDVEFVACVDIDKAVRDKVAAERDWPTFERLGEASAAVDADGALVASPSLLHGEHAME
jgi:predicted dehydrogenase